MAYTLSYAGSLPKPMTRTLAIMLQLLVVAAPATTVYANVDLIDPRQADLNDDGSVDRRDVSMLFNKLRAAPRSRINLGEPGYDPSFDVNEDEVVDLSDARQLVLVGQGPNAQNVDTTTSDLGTLFGGFVKDADGQFLENVQVTVSLANGQQLTTQSDDRGFYEMNVPVGATGMATVSLDGSRAVNRSPLPSTRYASYRDLPFFINGGMANVMNPIALPALDMTGSLQVTSAQTLTETQTLTNGDLQLNIPAGCRITLPAGAGDRISLTRLDLTNTPVAMRTGLYSNNLVALQPEGTEIICPDQTAVSLNFPNRDQFPLSTNDLEFETLQQGAYQTLTACTLLDQDGNNTDGDPSDRIECAIPALASAPFRFALAQVRSATPQPTVTISGQVTLTSDTSQSAQGLPIQLASLDMAGLAGLLQVAMAPTGPVIGPGNFLLFNDGRRLRTLGDGSFQMANVPSRLTTNGNAPGAMATNLLEIVGNPLLFPRAPRVQQAPRLPTFSELAFARRVFVLPPADTPIQGPGPNPLPTPVAIGPVTARPIPSAAQRPSNPVNPPQGTAMGRVLRLDATDPLRYTALAGQVLTINELNTGRSFTTVTDADGNYAVTVNGRYTLDTTAINRGPGNVRLPPLFRLPNIPTLFRNPVGEVRFPGDVSVTNVLFYSQANSLQILLTDLNGVPVPDFDLRLFNPGGNVGGIFNIEPSGGFATTDVNGSGRFADSILPLGDCEVAVRRLGTGNYVYQRVGPEQGCVLTQAGQDLSLNVAIDPTDVPGDVVQLDIMPDQADLDGDPSTPLEAVINFDLTYRRPLPDLSSLTYLLYFDSDRDPSTGDQEINRFAPFRLFANDQVNVSQRAFGADFSLQCSPGQSSGRINCSLWDLIHGGSAEGVNVVLRFAVDPSTGQEDRSRIRLTLPRSLFTRIAGAAPSVDLLFGAGYFARNEAILDNGISSDELIADLLTNSGKITLTLDNELSIPDPTGDMNFLGDPNDT